MRLTDARLVPNLATSNFLGYVLARGPGHSSMPSRAGNRTCNPAFKLKRKTNVRLKIHVLRQELPAEVDGMGTASAVHLTCRLCKSKGDALAPTRR